MPYMRLYYNSHLKSIFFSFTFYYFLLFLFTEQANIKQFQFDHIISILFFIVEKLLNKMLFLVVYSIKSIL